MDALFGKRFWLIAKPLARPVSILGLATRNRSPQQNPGPAAVPNTELLHITSKERIVVDSSRPAEP
jgi:hypothetical protein